MKKAEPNTSTDGAPSPILSGLVDGPTLLKTEFYPEPSMRWLRERTRRKEIPFLRIGGKILFDRSRVRRALQQKFAVE